MRHCWNAAIAPDREIRPSYLRDWSTRGQGSRGVEAETRQYEADQKKKKKGKE